MRILRTSVSLSLVLIPLLLAACGVKAPPANPTNVWGQGKTMPSAPSSAPAATSQPDSP